MNRNVYPVNKQKIIINDEEPNTINKWFGSWIPSWPYNNLPNDIIGNPYAPPLRDERYFIPPVGVTGTYIPPGAIPINVSTNVGAVDTNYRQLGILTPLNGSNKDNIVPLMGRPLFTNRDQWQYYAVSNQRNGVKVPITVSGKNATNEYGVKEIYDGTNVIVNGYNKPYRVEMYESDTIKYLPYV